MLRPHRVASKQIRYVHSLILTGSAYIYFYDSSRTELKYGPTLAPTAFLHGFSSGAYPFPVCTSCVRQLKERHVKIFHVVVR